MLAVVRVRVRSKAGVPFDVEWCRVPVDWMEIVSPVSQVAGLRRNRWIDCELLDEAPTDPEPTANLGVALRIRVRRGFEQVRFDIPGLERQARLVRLTSPELIEKLRDDIRLEVRDHDARLFPDTVFVRVRTRSGWVNSVRTFGEARYAYALSFSDFSIVRFDERLEVDLLEPEAMPPLEAVSVRSCTGRPFIRFGRPFQPDRWIEVDLYPSELEELLACDHLEHKELSESVQTSDGANDAASDPIESATAAESSTDAAALVTSMAAPESTDAASDDDRVELDPCATPIARIRAWASQAEVRTRGRQCEGFTMQEICSEVLGDLEITRSRAFTMEVAAMLRELGWEHLPLRRRGSERVRPYLPPEE